MTKRIILLLSGLAVAYLTAYSGNGLHGLIANAASRSEQIDWGVIAAFLGIMSALVGSIFWLSAMSGTLRSYREEPPEVVAAYAAIALVCFSFLFGMVAGPFSSHGPYPWVWMSYWSWIPALALVPTILVGRDLLAEAALVWRNRKTIKKTIKR